jgi:NAD(P)-dependent dehydrogenase (short-subunit alcohol dehydrogenase family)
MSPLNPRRLLIRAPRAEAVNLAGRRFLVTGAAPGSLGFETARLLAAWGAAVTLTTRANTERVAAMLPGTVDGHALDLANTGSVQRFARWYAERHGALDVLVNNAGVHLDLLSQWQQPKLSADGYETHWRINYLGTAQLTQQLLPALRAAAQARGQARVVNVVSKLHAKGSNKALFAAPARYDSWAAYGTSKLALMHHSFEMQRRCAGEGIQAYCLHPGSVFTHIADKGLAGNPKLEALRRALAPVEALFLLTPEEGAQTTLHCAASPDAQGGQYYAACKPASTSADARDAAVAARLWQDTARWLDTQA